MGNSIWMISLCFIFGKIGFVSIRSCCVNALQMFLLSWFCHFPNTLCSFPTFVVAKNLIIWERKILIVAPKRLQIRQITRRERHIFPYRYIETAEGRNQQKPSHVILRNGTQSISAYGIGSLSSHTSQFHFAGCLL